MFDHSGHVGVVGSFEILVAEGVELVGIESAGYEEEIGCEGFEFGDGFVCYCVEPVFGGGVWGHGEIEVGVACAAFFGAPGSGIVGVLMETEVEDGGVVVEGMLCTVAMMHVPVEDSDALESGDLAQPLCGNGDIVEEAEAHGVVGFGVMTGGAHGREHVVVLTFDYLFAGFDRGTGSEQGGIPGAFYHVGVGIGTGGFAGAGLFDEIDVVGCVNVQEIVSRGGFWIDARRIDGGLFESIPNRGEAFGAFWMSVRGDMLIADF